MPYADVEPDEVKARIARGEDVFLLDVREPDEVAAWSYPVGVNIPLGQLGDRLDELPRDVTIVVACHVGGRSAAAARALSDAGWTAENLTRRRGRLGGRRDGPGPRLKVPRIFSATRRLKRINLSSRTLTSITRGGRLRGSS